MKRKTIILVSFLLVLYVVPSITTPTEQNMSKEFSLSTDYVIQATSGEDDYADSLVLDGFNWAANDEREYADFDCADDLEIQTLSYSVYAYGHNDDGYFEAWNGTDWNVIETVLETEEIHSWYNGTLDASAYVLSGNIIRLGIRGKGMWYYCAVDYLEITISDFPYESGEWYDKDWGFRKMISIEGASGAGTNYQVQANVTFVTGKMQADFDDVLFTDNNGLTLLDFWRESYVASTTASFWVEVKDNLDTDQMIYMYFGNDEANTASDGDATFPTFIDKTDTTGWTTSNIAVSASGDFLRFYNPTAGDGGTAERYDLSSPADFQMMSQLKTVSLGAADQGVILLGDASATDRFSYSFSPVAANQAEWQYHDGALKAGGAWVEGTEFIFTVQVDEGDATTGIDFRRYDTSWGLLDSVLGENFAAGSPVDCDGIYLGDASGAATIDMYIRWLAFRKCVDVEPIVTIGAGITNAPPFVWNDAGETIIYFHVPFDYWAFDMILIFLGLGMIILGSLYGAYKIRNDPDRTTMIVVLLLFMFGFALFLGGIGFVGGV